MTMRDETRVPTVADVPVLSVGAHASLAEGTCAMEAVSYLAGEPWVIAAFLRRWNDDLPDADRDRLLRPVLRRVVGSRATSAVERRRAWLATDWLVRETAPAWLALTPALAPHAAALRTLPPITAPAVAHTHQPVVAAAAAAAWAAADDVVSAAAADAAWAAADDVVSAAAADAAWAAADAAWAASDAAAAARDAARAAAGRGLLPVVATLQASARRLLDAMLQAGAGYERRHG